MEQGWGQGCGSAFRAGVLGCRLRAEGGRVDPTRWVPSRGTPRVPAPLHLSPFSLPDRDRRVDSPVSLSKLWEMAKNRDT